MGSCSRVRDPSSHWSMERMLEVLIYVTWAGKSRARNLGVVNVLPAVMWLSQLSSRDLAWPRKGMELSQV